MTASPDERLPVTAVVLPADRAARPASGRLPANGRDEPAVARVAEVVAGICAQTLLVAIDPSSPGEAGVGSFATVVDDGRGPLGGLAVAMAAADHDWVLAVAADMSDLEPDLVRALWAARGGADVVALRDHAGPRPLPALYRVAVCLPAARTALGTGRRRLAAILASVSVVELPVGDPAEVDLEQRLVGDPDPAAPAGDVGEAVRQPVSPTVTFGGTRKLPSERPVTIYLNDAEVATTQATPSDLDELAVGFLVSEGLIRDRSALVSVEADVGRGIVHVTSREVATEDMAARTRYLTSGCGGGVTFSSVGHARGLKPVVSDMRVAATALHASMGEMARAAVLYRETGGMHACALARDGKLVLIREDVGRHNALDKLLGRAWLDGISTRDAVLMSTGRISYEMAVKAAKAAVPIVATRSAVTDLAADIGNELGITLVGYVRGAKLTVYTHPERVLVSEVDAT